MRVVLAIAFCLAGSAFAAFRPPAVPLVSVDPHFSLWSRADCLYDADTTHWTGAKQPLGIYLEADGVTYRLCGRGNDAALELPVLRQTSCQVGATVTTYRFEGEGGLAAEVAFTTPRLTDDLKVFSRPVTYLDVTVSGAREWRVRAEIASSFATNDDGAEMSWTTNAVAGVTAVSVGRTEQSPFSTRGDWRRPDWGRAWLVGPETKGSRARFLLAYDNVKAVRFFGDDLEDWWRFGNKSFGMMLEEALREGDSLTEKCKAFDDEFRRDMVSVGGEKYADIAALAWRQSFAACRLVVNALGEPFMFSAENGSGGMIGTTDVFYPQFPHLLTTSLTLAKATLAPTCVYATSTNWPYAYAPHDLGIFPVADGQFYGMKPGQAIGGGDDDTFRMPVEECGNMLILLGAVAKAEGNADFAGCWWGEVKKWAEYIAQFGSDPGSQLCTDDFAGHMAHNANLALKSALATASYAMMAKMRGENAEAGRYRALAERMAADWMAATEGGAYGGTRMAFDRPGTWSLKYNLVWDELLGLNLFPRSLAEKEMGCYRKTELAYGMPLDCRKTYAKADWSIWCGSLTGRKEDLEFMADGIHRFLCETPDREPFTDWYMADARLFRGFIARSVVGGVFLPVLRHPELVSKYRRQAGLPAQNLSRVDEIASCLPEKPRTPWCPPSDREAWRKLAGTMEASRIIASAEQEMDEAVPELSDELYLEYLRTGGRSNYGNGYFTRLRRLELFTMAEALEYKGRFLPHIARYLEAILNERAWTIPAHDPGLYCFHGMPVLRLFSAETARHVAYAVAWFGDRLSPGLAERAREECRRRVLRPYLSACRDIGEVCFGGPWWFFSDVNWTAVCHAECVMAALALLDDKRERAECIEGAERGMPFFFNGFGADGYCLEGIGYWNYGFGHYVGLAVAVSEATKGRIGFLSDSPQAKSIARYAVDFQMEPDLYPSFADGGGVQGARPSGPMLALSRWLWPDVISDSMSGCSPINNLWKAWPECASIALLEAVSSDSAFRSGAEWTLPAFTAFDSSQVYLFRPPSGGRGLALAAKGGHNGETGHNHNDVGSYSISLGGRIVCGDVGPEAYTARTFSPRRYESPFLNSYGHPVPRVGGVLQGAGPSYSAKKVSSSSGENFDEVVLDLTGAYDLPELKILKRTFRRSHGTGEIVIRDEVEFLQPSAFDVPVTAFAAMKTVGNALELIADGAKLTVSASVEGGTWHWDERVIEHDGSSPMNKKLGSPRRVAVAFDKPVSSACVEMRFQFKE